MGDNEMAVNCLVCGERISNANEQHLTVNLADGSTFYAHKRCVQAIRMLITNKASLPNELGESCPDLVHSLFLEHWFSESRTLNDVSSEIKRMGYNYSSATISNVLRSFTRKGILTRRGKPRSYTYVQKRPPA
ncbi:MAG: hypothetical protein DRN81_04930 [Thermoproteota archaeon]|nr:MAG: hypothetical protein DRN81_04930 [Candidatus Korarchaeota archaeon]